ncbi:MAG: ABC transporter ATP-binding protein [Xanthomonadales bacterium]|nr:ABC transporter ATP-binding protein [Xanthomonadales bacterium]
MKPVISLNDVYLADGNSIVLSDIFFQINPGEVVCLLGRNGSGKTTLLSLISGIRPATSGEIMLFGQVTSTATIGPEIRRRMAIAPESPHFPAGLSVRQCAKFTRASHTEKWDQDYFEFLLNEFEIESQRKANKLSRGQRTALAIILALARKPDLLVLDDPTLGLDAVARQSLLGILIQVLAAGTSPTMLLATHDPELVERMSDRILVMQKGRLIKQTSLEQLQLDAGGTLQHELMVLLDSQPDDLTKTGTDS